MADSWCFLSSGSSTGFVCRSNILGLSTWLALLSVWQLRTEGQLPEGKHSEMPSRCSYDLDLEATVSLPPHCVGQNNSQVQSRFKMRWNRLYLPVGVLQSILVIFNQLPFANNLFIFFTHGIDTRLLSRPINASYITKTVLGLRSRGSSSKSKCGCIGPSGVSEVQILEPD